MRNSRYLLVILSCLSLVACQLTPRSEENNSNELSDIAQGERDKLIAGASERPSLASLNLQPARKAAQAKATIPKAQTIPRLSLEQKRDEYAALLALINDPLQKQQIAFRLADIKMLLAEQNMEQGTAQQNIFEDAIRAYLDVINNITVALPKVGEALSELEQQNNAKLMDSMYQLSRALELAGERQQSVDFAKEFLATFPKKHFAITDKHIELFFRIGEFYFNQQNFAQAITYYRKVVENQSPNVGKEFFGISAYMLGWSHFKRESYEQALLSFNKMLDFHLSNIPNIETVKVEDLSLRKGELRLIKDSLRVMALTFSYQGNDEAVNKFYDNVEQSNFQHLIYEELAQQHLDDDRYQDSAKVLIGFASRFPTHPRAIEFFVRHVDAFILGGFADKVIEAKQKFVAQYALGNGVISDMESVLGQQASPYLQQYLPELAQTEHSIAQGIFRLISKNKSKTQSVDFNQAFSSDNISQQQISLWRTSNSEELQALSKTAFQNAITYYQSFIASFENQAVLSGQVAELRFYMAEALFSIEKYQEAIQAFEIYAYQDKQNPMAVEAAYAAILALEKMTAPNSEPKVSAAHFNQAQNSQKRFVEHFAADRRSPTIALNLMQSLFKRNQYQQAIAWANWFLEDAKHLHSFDKSHLNSAILVMAHSHYALKDFVIAETFYLQILSRLDKQDKRTFELSEALSASIYKQAEETLAAQALDAEYIATLDLANSRLSAEQLLALEEALVHIKRLLTTTPNADIAVIARYDRASYNALLGNWNKAIEQWQAFASAYPSHRLSKNIEPQVLFAYEKTENWSKAAELLLARYYKNEKSEKGRLSLYTAAEYFDKSNKRDLALDSFRRYAHAFPEPMDMANEARFRMSEFYLASNEQSKRRFWLNKMMRAQLNLNKANPAEAGTSRSRYLAAMSAMVFARDAHTVFKRAKLNIPLERSLRKKQKALEKAIQSYDRVMSFAVAEYTTQANYQLASLYSRLADDLMDSQRPKGLSALEKEQYDMLLEEQAYPFEETAIQIHENNIARVKSGLYDEHIKASFKALSKFLPARYNKPEVLSEVNDEDL